MMMIQTVLLVASSVLFSQASVEYVSDNIDRVAFQHQAWGQLGIDTAVKPGDNRPGQPLCIKDKTYTKGLGHHAPGEMMIMLDGEFAAFDAEVGVQQQNNGAASVVFQVFVDDEKRFDSGVMREADAARPVHVDLSGADSMRLVVTDAGDGITCDCANWAEARLTRAANADMAKIEYCDMAPWATVVTSDPNQAEGTKATRVQPMPAADVCLDAEAKRSNDIYEVAPNAEGKAAIGLRWNEYRLVRSLGIELSPTSPKFDIAKTQVQYWTGESPWQGKWNTLNGAITVSGNRVSVDVDRKKNPNWPSRGVDKVRWVFSSKTSPVLVDGFEAKTLSHWKTARLLQQIETGDKEITTQMYNGYLIPVDKKQPVPLGDPLVVDVKYTNPRPWKSDRTMMRISCGGKECTIAVEDVLKAGQIYVPAVGVYLAAGESPMTLAEYKQSIAGKKTILEQVRQLPDQTFASAMQKARNPVQDLGPMMLSAPCNAWKVFVHRDGTLQLELDGKSPDNKFACNPSCKIIPKFGSGKNENIERHLAKDWLPVPVTTVREGDVIYRQTTWVGSEDAPSGIMVTGPSYCAVQYEIENAGNAPADVSLALNVTGMPLTAAVAEGGVVFSGNGRTPIEIDSSREPVRWQASGNTATLARSMPAGAKMSFTLLTPAQDSGFKPDFEENLKCWTVLNEGAQISVPDPLFQNIIQASPMHCEIAARPDDDNQTLQAWIASDRYGPLESEAHSVILGMDMMGHHEFARRSLEYFIRRYAPEGYLTTGYTLMGTGWHLWTLARHMELTGDWDWFNGVAPDVYRAAKWIANELEKTKENPDAPEFGLVPPGVGADWNRFAYRFAVEAHYCAGLREAAKLLALNGYPGWQELQKSAEEFQKHLVQAFHWNQARTPVWPIANGTWIRPYGGMLYAFGMSGEMVPGEDADRSWCYDVELGSHHMIALGVIDAKSDEATELMNHMEDYWFLHAGWGDYPADKSHEDWFNRGGFSKVQPYYTRNAEIYAMRDDVKPFVRSYFNAAASLVSTENLSFWEHFNNMGAWNKTHETGWFLVQTATMYARSPNSEELWVAPFVPNNWMQDGMQVSVKNLPTRFGRLMYTIKSAANEGHIDADIELSLRMPLDRMIVRLRHPQEKPMRNVTVQGCASYEMDPAKECVVVKSPTNVIKVRAEY